MTTEAPKVARGELMSASEVARKIKRSPSLIPALVQAGRLTVFYKGSGRTGAYLFDSADVDDYLETRDHPAAPLPLEPPAGSIVRASGVTYTNDGEDHAPANWSSDGGEPETWLKIAGNYGPVEILKVGP